MSSSNKIDYSSRVNKSIERKLIAEGINILMSQNSYKYKYIGFGSVWFTDFSLFHKLLHIDKMVSIEHDSVIYKRAVHNKPYQCIDIEFGDSSEKLSEILKATDTPSFIWLDYDSNIFNCASYTTDVDAVVNNSQSGTVLLVTMNLLNNSAVNLKKEFTENDEWFEKSKDLLNNTFGMLDLSALKKKQLTDQEKFIPTTNQFFSATVKNSIYKAGSNKVFYKIFDFMYRDGAPMATQGFLILDKDRTNEYEKIKQFAAEYFLNEETFKIQAPILTTREKYSLDKSLPAIDVNNFIEEKGIFQHNERDYINENDLIGFPVSVDSFVSYARLYKYYPTFSEILVT